MLITLITSHTPSCFRVSQSPSCPTQESYSLPALVPDCRPPACLCQFPSRSFSDRFYLHSCLPEEIWTRLSRYTCTSKAASVGRKIFHDHNRSSLPDADQMLCRLSAFHFVHWAGLHRQFHVVWQPDRWTASHVILLGSIRLERDRHTRKSERADWEEAQDYYGYQEC